ncbi:MAG: 4-phosphoerythronate dehydrogenase [Clostridium sp.]|nr:4-phosphoerythronate dehydrogenase [Prevotella sp.]MCM1429013.1 4-phosphoerythronate dehydrogenase [Clostridium sp.]MCM1475457.1 4-phosphoerythronate dehydrogenase [Muribaculaceae bacterium]
MKIIIDDAIPFLEGRIPAEVEQVILPGAAIVPADVADADALLVRTRTRCDAALLKDSRVKLVATATIGADHFNMPELSALGIEAVNSPGCNAPAVAQYAWSSLLRAGFNPKSHTLGLIGKGKVGFIVAEWGRKLGAKILVCDPPRREAGMSDEVYVSLEEVCGRCDAITLHVPLTRSGKHATLNLIGSREFEAMRPGTILVNASRGGVVDEEAWKKNIKQKNVRAIVDTWKGEPRIDKDLLELAFIATPHIAGYSLQGKERATRMVLEALKRKFDVNVVTTGLEPQYEPLKEVTEQLILNSYNPFDDDRLLRNQPDGLEILRDTYDLRPEINRQKC